MSKRVAKAAPTLDRDGDGDVDADDAIVLLTEIVEKLGERLGDIEEHSYVKSLVRRIRKLF